MEKGLCEAKVSVRYLRGLKFAPIALVAALFFPSVAEAQVAPYSVRISPETYQPLTAATALSISGDDQGGPVGAPFPITFFGQSYSDFSVGTNGYAVFGGGSATTWTNATIPSSSAPNAIIAAWWDDNQCNAGGISKETRGTAPNRTFVVQWHCYRRTVTTQTIEMQLWLFEGSTTIQVKYGANGGGTHNATAGIENQTGTVGYPGLACGTNCLATNWPTNQVITYSQGPDLTVESVTAPAVGYAGVTAHLEAEAANVGGMVATGAALRFWISADATLSPATDHLVGTAPQTHDIAPGARATFSLDATLPAGLVPGSWHLLAEVDPLKTIAEGGEQNNVGASAPFQIDLPAPDLTVDAVVAPARASTGMPMTVEWTARNRGNLPAVGVPYSVYLSANDVITLSDRKIFDGTVSVAALSSAPVAVQVPVPASMPAGAYWLGVIVDPANVVTEIDEQNNAGAAKATFPIESGTLQIATAVMPAAEVGANYCLELRATGGDGFYEWSLDGGMLPVGLALEEERSGGASGELLATLLCGMPGSLGTHEFTLRVASAELSATRDFVLEVIESGSPLTIATRVIRNAVAKGPYESTLLAVGGRPPYEWSLIEGVLPEGIRLTSEGVLHGVPTADGRHAFTVRAQDAAGGEALMDLDLLVATPGSITCMTSSLPSRMLDEPFGDVLRVAGGTAPYTWRTVESRRLRTALDEGLEYGDKPPAGLTLAEDGRVGGTPLTAGRYLWQVRVVGSDSNQPASCAITFDVDYEQGIPVTTTAVATAYAGVPYTAELTVSGGLAPYRWSLGTEARLPAGLELSDDGVLEGVLPLAALEGKDAKLFSFTVKVRDAANRITVAPLSVKLVEKPLRYEAPEVPESGGCQTGGGAGGLLGLGAALGFAALRRRR